MFAPNNMMFAEQTHTSDHSQGKRRRFAPSSLPVIVAGDFDSVVDYNSPALLQLADRSPSQQEIETELLQVGMRIRKPVNDANQTSGRRAFTPRPFMSSRLSPETLSAMSQSPSNNANSCAGVLARQPLSTATFCGVSLAVMAHISTATPIGEQKLWSYSTSSKRRQHFEEDSDSDDSQEFMPRTPQLEYADAGMSFSQDYFNIDFDNMSDVSPMTQVGQPRTRIPGRKLAQPKSKLRSVPQEPLPFINPFVQIAAPRSSFQSHKRMNSCGMEAMMDFGEAAFLQPRQDVDMDCS